jgi:hypothetical protein
MVRHAHQHGVHLAARVARDRADREPDRRNDGHDEAQM